jgi:hypothetical protein
MFLSDILSLLLLFTFIQNVYEPLSVLGGSVSPDVCEIMATVRNALEIA